MKKTSGQSQSTHPAGHVRSAGFTLIDVLVSITVIALLIGIMLPSIAKVRESTRRIICSSDMRQIGLGMSIYAEDNRDTLPSSVFLDNVNSRTAYPLYPHLMDTIRTSSNDFEPREWDQWDGLGLLFYKEYITAPDVYYCPSHTGDHQLEDYQDEWTLEGSNEIIANFQYRGVGPRGQRQLYNMRSTDAVVTDTLRSIEDLNHDKGLNILAAGLSVAWFDDADSQIVESILSRTNDTVVENANKTWTLFDGDHVSRP